MYDRTLLEDAARAAGIEICYPFGPGEIYVRWTGPWEARDTSNEQGALVIWNPLTDDGQALRLAVKLGIEFVQFTNSVRANAPDAEDCHEWRGTDPYAATRRAIVRAAASIGRLLDTKDA